MPNFIILIAENSSFLKPSSGAAQPKKQPKVAFNLLPGTSKHVNTNLQTGTSKQLVQSNYQVCSFSSSLLMKKKVFTFIAHLNL